MSISGVSFHCISYIILCNKTHASRNIFHHFIDGNSQLAVLNKHFNCSDAICTVECRKVYSLQVHGMRWKICVIEIHCETLFQINCEFQQSLIILHKHTYSVITTNCTMYIIVHLLLLLNYISLSSICIWARDALWY